MRVKHFLLFILITFFTSIVCAEPSNLSNKNKRFSKIMVVIFENMSYAEIKNEPTFKKLVEYTGYTLDNNGKLVKLKKEVKSDTTGNGYAFFSSYYNNHDGSEPTRPSQPNYIALTSGSIHGISDNENYDLDVDNLASELIDAKITWKVYADDLPDPKAPIIMKLLSKLPKNDSPVSKTFVRNPSLSEALNDIAEENYQKEFKQLNHIYQDVSLKNGFNPTSGCFIGAYNKDGGDQFDGYARKHEPFISYLNIQNNYEHCKNILNSSHLLDDINNLPTVSFYIPNQINDGHNGTLEERIVLANAFLSKMMGRDPATGEPLSDVSNAPFQKFLDQGGLLVITFDEPSVTGNPDKTIYTLFAGKMIRSGAYPDKEGQHSPICYPNSKDCNHFNLLKLIENNWNLRGLDPKNTSDQYKVALALDNGIPELWKS